MTVDPSSEYLQAAKANRLLVEVLQYYEAKMARPSSGWVFFGPANLPAKLRELIK